MEAIKTNIVAMFQMFDYGEAFKFARANLPNLPEEEVINVVDDALEGNI